MEKDKKVALIVIRRFVWGCVDGFTTREKHEVLIKCHPSLHEDKTAGMRRSQIPIPRISASQRFPLSLNEGGSKVIMAHIKQVEQTLAERVFHGNYRSLSAQLGSPPSDWRVPM
jgi:hypothetical protein